MPFTVAHIGFSKPIKRLLKKHVDVEALCVASVVPDLDIVLTGSRFHMFSFSWTCILFVLIPLSVLLYYLWRYFIKKPIFHYFNIEEEVHLPSNNSKFLILWSLIVGIFVHLGLDLITHYNNYIVITNVFHMDYYSKEGKVFDIILLYIPQLIFSLWGLYLFFRLLPGSMCNLQISSINTTSLPFPVIIGLIASSISFFIFREHSFFFDHIILSATCGAAYAILFYAGLFYFVNEDFRNKYFKLICSNK